MTDSPIETSGDEWWRTAVIYQVYVRSFADADGDGIGDLEGIRSRLPYLRDLGVDAVWVTPFYPSPMADGGYDVADYRDIDPLFGSLDDAEKLVKEAHEHGLRLIVDLVPNHTSDQHAWFQEALASPPGSAARARYLFRRGRAGGSEPPNDWLSVFGGPAWERVPDGEWYLHLFAPEQPDLDWTNPEVIEEFHDVLRFWLDRGVDGFRIDVAHGLAKDPSMPDVGESPEAILEPTKRVDHPFWDRDEVHDVYAGWRQVTDSYGPDRMLIGEAWVATAERRARYVRPGELHGAFNFDFLKCDWDAAAFRAVIDTCLRADSAVGAPTTWVLANHDVVREVTRYGSGDVGLRRARAAALLMLALPGGAYVYQGEELGLEEVEDLPEAVLQDPTWLRSGHTVRGRDGCRVPVPWTTSGPSLGFGPGEPWLPQPTDWAKKSVQAQSGVDGSTLELYRRALAYRRQHLLGFDIEWLATPPGTLGFRRRASSGDGTLCLVNVDGGPLALPPHDEVVLVSDPLDDGRLPADTAVWLRSR
ncbi:MAG TPA: alpha-amylase family glycosyl hydrolase [Actinomycetes bacterium]|nr:alpha-amylase family glycosyl hydrolase [Actinomycetes bacterium]